MACLFSSYEYGHQKAKVFLLTERTGRMICNHLSRCLVFTGIFCVALSASVVQGARYFEKKGKKQSVRNSILVCIL